MILVIFSQMFLCFSVIFFPIAAFLLILFIILENCEPFQRLIHQEELWLYQNPQTKSYVTGTELWLFIVFPLPFLSIIYHIICYKFQRKNALFQHIFHMSSVLWFLFTLFSIHIRVGTLLEA